MLMVFLCGHCVPCCLGRHETSDCGNEHLGGLDRQHNAVDTSAARLSYTSRIAQSSEYNTSRIRNEVFQGCEETERSHIVLDVKDDEARRGLPDSFVVLRKFRMLQSRSPRVMIGQR
jgi:hypothetical protein